MLLFLISLNYYIVLINSRLYIPTMLVIGLHGWILPPVGIVLCDFFVYSEFMIHPLVLLATSSKMRKEIVFSIRAKVLVSVKAITPYGYTTYFRSYSTTFTTLAASVVRTLKYVWAIKSRQTIRLQLNWNPVEQSAETPTFCSLVHTNSQEWNICRITVIFRDYPAE